MSGAAWQRILLIQLRHLGDVMLATPTIRAARQAFPNTRIDFLTGALGAQALEANPHLNNILVDPSLIQLYRTHYDAVADMHSMPRTALRVAATRAPLRVGIRGRGPRNLVYTHLLERVQGPVYMARQKLRVLKPLGVNTENADLSLEIVIEEEQRAWARQALSRLARPIVAISPVAKHAFKQWGEVRWSVVADALASAGAAILITSGPGEEAQAEAVAREMKRPALWQYGRTTVRQLAALYAECRLWVGNDGGPKHIAVAAGTPTVSVVRGNLGGLWSDLRPASGQIALNARGDSLASITPQQVIAEATRLLGVV
jgi:ADP-heptose:LPS heptosyltransferase